MTNTGRQRLASASSPIGLPAGHHYAVTSGFDQGSSGMVTALLHRSRCFVQETGGEVSVVTYDHRDYDTVRTTFYENGQLVAGVHVLNLFEDLRSWDDSALERAKGTFDPTILRDPFVAVPAASPEHPHWVTSEVTIADGRTAKHRWHLRDDGSLLINERRVESEGHLGRPEFTLCDRRGARLGTWTSRGDMVRFWFDTLPRDPVAWFIVDDKSSADMMIHYRRDDAVTMHVIHGTHVKPGTIDTLSDHRANVMRRLDQFDAVVFLSQQQLDHVAALPGLEDTLGNRFVCPNACHLPSSLPAGRRDRRRGVVVARLDGRKRIDHAITAISRNSTDSIRASRRPRLDVYGKGARLAWLEGFLAAAAHHPDVTFHGFRTDAREEFATASFSMLTSKNEGFPLVLAESMGRGCIPIAYDLNFGPAAIIDHGVDGFLVPYNDQVELAATVAHVMSMGRFASARMRRAAKRKAQRYTGSVVTRRWVEIMDDALNRKIARPARTSTTADEAVSGG